MSNLLFFYKFRSICVKFWSIHRSVSWLFRRFCSFHLRLGYNHYLEAIVNNFERHTEKFEKYIENIFDCFSKARFCLTFGCFCTIQCSQTLTRCSKQNWFVTRRLGHLQSPIFASFWTFCLFLYLCDVTQFWQFSAVLSWDLRQSQNLKYNFESYLHYLNNLL